MVGDSADADKSAIRGVR